MAEDTNEMVHEITVGDLRTNLAQTLAMVSREGKTLIVTVHNKPVARIVPILDTGTMPFGALRGEAPDMELASGE